MLKSNSTSFLSRRVIIIIISISEVIESAYMLRECYPDDIEKHF